MEGEGQDRAGASGPGEAGAPPELGWAQPVHILGWTPKNVHVFHPRLKTHQREDFLGTIPLFRSDTWELSRILRKH